jgi:EAL domain-containing protein (putative c-di-GMP-specific phosphodiesterase class I)/PleD family two-component response regulator
MNGNNPRVLIADDDAVSLLVARAALESSGFDVVSAADGVMAVEAFGQQRPDIVILDVVMPRMDGYEACRQIRASAAGRDVPVLIMTSHDDVEAVARAYDTGATDFLSKGISSRLMIERVRFVLREFRSRRALEVSRERLAMVQSMARIGHWEVDSAGRTQHASDLVKSLLPAEADGSHLAQFAAALRPDDGRQLLEAFRNWQQSCNPFRLEGCLRNGAHLHVHGVTTQGSGPGDAPTLTLAVQDISELRRAQQQVHLLTHFDSLTGLPNRRQFRDALAATIRGRAAGSPLWLLGFRLHGVDRLQQSLGQAALEEALVSAAQLMIGAMRLQEGDSFAHLGGGEFALYRPGCDSPAAAVAVAEDVLQALASPLAGDGWTLTFRVRAGIVGWPADGTDADALLENARATAARSGATESSYGFYSAEAQQGARRRMSLESALHGACERGEVMLAYQPRVSLADGDIRGCEALMRWQHPELGSVPPTEFIPLAEDTGMIAPLGAWALREACGRMAEWRRDTGRQLVVSVNVSAHQLRNPRGFVEDVLAALEASALPAAALELELTESAFIDATDESLAALRELRSLGISLALDDFGTGYSSLACLRRLPVDCLKIDRSFVADLPGDGEGARVLQAILGVADALRLRTVAEGVETPEQLELLRHEGCLEAQGFLLSGPVPAAGFLALLDAGEAKSSGPVDAPPVERTDPQRRIA